VLITKPGNEIELSPTCISTRLSRCYSVCDCAVA